MNAHISCETALEAIQNDPLDLPEEVQSHLRTCIACAEARVQWLALEEAPPALAPAGYMEALTGRVMLKLPTPRPLARGRRFLWWSAAAFLLVAGGTGGYLAGRATQHPVTEAVLQKVENEALPEAPFQDPDDAMSALPSMTAEESKALLQHLEQAPSR